MSIQVSSIAEMSFRLKIKQLQTKLISTAAIEMKLLTLFHLSVKRVTATALPSGATSTSQGKVEFIGLAG
jgi:hypothetical protein